MSLILITTRAIKNVKRVVSTTKRTTNSAKQAVKGPKGATNVPKSQLDELIGKGSKFRQIEDITRLPKSQLGKVISPYIPRNKLSKNCLRLNRFDRRIENIADLFALLDTSIDLKQSNSTFIQSYGWVANITGNTEELLGSLLIEWSAQASRYGYQDILYRNVSYQWYTALEGAPSQGKFVRVQIRNTFTDYNIGSASSEFRELSKQYEDYKRRQSEEGNVDPIGVL